MSDLELETASDDLLVHLSADALDPTTVDPETLKQRIRALIHRYVHQRSPRIASAVATYSGALALHPALRDQPEQLCAFCRLHWHWRLLAVQCPTAASA